MKVHILFGGFDWEGSRVLRVYADEKKAEEMCVKLTQHREVMPDENDAYRDWITNCPLEQCHAYDSYHTEAYEVEP